MTPENAPFLIVALLALGMAEAFIVADRSSATSRALTAFLASIGVSVAVNVLFEAPMHVHGEVPWWVGVFAIPEVLAFVFALEWLSRVRMTAMPVQQRGPGRDRLLRTAQALAVSYGLAAFAFPSWRVEHFINVIRDHHGPQHAGFFLFAVPLGLALVLALFASLQMFERRPDPAETRRVVTFVLAAPFLALGMLLPLFYAAVFATIGLLVFLVGAVQYHVSQGRRAQFMARFLAPQVAEMVTRHGLRRGIGERTAEVSVVCCDLRGFTAFTEATSSERVMRILQEYYDLVGQAAMLHGGTIKDQAGDGVLILVGAPLSLSDHADRAIQLARRIRDTVITMTDRWSGEGLSLGMGVGVASGFVTVGVIGAASRLEYTAVGSAVNLAARLCSEATHGEILVYEHTLGLLEDIDLTGDLSEPRELRLKGFEQPVRCFALTGG